MNNYYRSVNVHIILLISIFCFVITNLLHITNAQNYQSSRNISITSKIDGSVNGFEPVRILNYPYQGDTLYLLIIPHYALPGGHGYALYNVNDPYNPTFFGKILINGGGTRDVESIKYSGDDAVRIFILELGSDSKIISIKLTYDNLLDIDNNYVHYNSLNTAAVTQTLKGVSDIEMIYQYDSVLYVATNKKYLTYYNVSSQTTFAKYADINFNPPSPYPTLHDLNNTMHLDNKLHEVKVFKTIDTTYVGCGLVRAGMCIVPINFSNRNNPGVGTLKYQLYEFDRTIFPDTIINPYKAYYDSLNWSGENQHKWDWRI